MDEDKPPESKARKQKKARRSQTHFTLGDMWDDVLSNKQPTLAHHEFGIVGELAEAIRLLMGWNVESEDVLGIQGDDIRHIHKNHGVLHFNKKGQMAGEKRKG